MFLKAIGKMKYSDMEPPLSDDKGFGDWEKDVAQILMWLWFSIESNVSSNVLFLKTSKKVRHAGKKMYYTDSNLTILYDLFSNILDAN